MSREDAKHHEWAFFRWIATDPKLTRKNCVEMYAELLRTRSMDLIDWPAVNRSIMNRWSLSGLKWIKDRAWKIVREGVKP